MLAAILLSAQARTTTFSHPCASAETVLAALGTELGLRLEPTGSVKKDYVLVHVKEQVPDVILDRIASTLGATWTEKSGVRYLGRTSAQERAIENYNHEVIRKAIEAYIAEAPAPRSWTRESAKAFLRPMIKSDGILDMERTASALAKEGPYKDLLVEFVRAIGPEALSVLQSHQHTRYRWQARGGDPRVPGSLRPKAETIARSVQAFGEAFRELGLSAPVGYGRMSPDSWEFGAQMNGTNLILQALSASTGYPLGSVFVNAIPDLSFLAAVPGLERPYVPSHLAKVFNEALKHSDSLGTDWQVVSAPTDPVLTELFEKGFPTDPLHLAAGEPLVFAAESAGLNTVAVFPDSLATIGSYRSIAGRPFHEALSTLLRSSVVELDKGWLSVRHSLAQGARERFDRAGLAAFALRSKADGWQRIEPLADLALNCDGYQVMWHALRLSEVINPEQSRFRMIGQQRFDLLNTFALLLPGGRQAAKSGGVTWTLSEMPGPAKGRLIEAMARKSFMKLEAPLPLDLGWKSHFEWAHPPREDESVDHSQGAVVEVRLDSARLFAVPDVKTNGLYMHSLMNASQAALLIRLARENLGSAPPGHTPTNYELLALVEAEMLTIKVRLPNGDGFECGLIVDAQSPKAKFLPHSELPGPEGDALRAALRGGH